MATFTRLQLRTYQTDSADFSVARTFELVNNLSTTAYFNIEGERLYISKSGVFAGYGYKDVFNSASLSSLVNCSVVTESVHAGFIVDPNSTATFTFTPSSTIAKEEVKFIASNTLVYSLGDNTASGSAFGVTLNTNA